MRAGFAPGRSLMWGGSRRRLEIRYRIKAGIQASSLFENTITLWKCSPSVRLIITRFAIDLAGLAQ
jgi:hypothetical protein